MSSKRSIESNTPTGRQCPKITKIYSIRSQPTPSNLVLSGHPIYRADTCEVGRVNDSVGSVYNLEDEDNISTVVDSQDMNLSSLEDSIASDDEFLPPGGALLMDSTQATVKKASRPKVIVQFRKETTDMSVVSLPNFNFNFLSVLILT